MAYSKENQLSVLNKVTKANDLIQATYQLTLQEHRIIATLISMIQPTDKHFQIYKFGVKEFANMVGVKGDMYTYIKKIVTDLQEKTLEIPTKNSTLVVNWLASAEYFDKEGYIELEISSKLKPYLLELRERFTSYQLQYVLRLSSNYSVRLYELLKQYQFTQHKTRIIELQVLREWLGLVDENQEKYSQYGHFKSKVLNVAKKNINEKTDIAFDFEEIKGGKKVTKIKFKLIDRTDKSKESDETVQLDIFDNTEPVMNNSLYSRINDLASKHGYFVNEKTVDRWEQLAKEKWDQDSENKLLFLVDEVNHNTSIENPIGYITAILKSKDEEINFSPNKKLSKEEKRRQLMLGQDDESTSKQSKQEETEEERLKRKEKMFSLLKG